MSGAAEGVQPVPEDEADWPSPRVAWSALALLMLGMFLSCIDRGVINLLVEPIKADFRLNDTQFGALQSLAFGTFYVTMAIPLGVLADRYQRRHVIAAGIAVFNVFAIMTGLARNYTQLFIARMGVGSGEASLSPSAFSMISDLFPPAKLGRAISLYAISAYVGTSAAMILGGMLFTALERLHLSDPARLLGFAPWQATVILAGLPGLLLFPCFLLLREPTRKGMVGKSRKISLRATLNELGKRRTVLLLLIGSGATINLQTQAIGMWMPALFIRTYHWSPAQIGFWMGMLLLGGSVIGAYLGGWVNDWMTAKGRPDAPVVVAGVSYAAGGVFGLAAPLMPTPELALLCFLPLFLLKPVAQAMMPIALQVVTPNQLRAQVSAIYLTAISLAGAAFGPILVGLASDYLFGAGTGLRYSMVLLTAISVPSTVLMMALARKPYLRIQEDAL